MAVKYYMKRLVSRYYEKAFRASITKVRELPAISNYCDENNVILLTMVQKKDVDMFLLAAKTLLNYLSVKKVVVVMDPTIDQDDINILKQHLVNVEFVRATDYRLPGVPVGGCWERIMALADYAQEYYVIQLDADTLTLSRPDEVIECVRNNVSFTLGTRDGVEIKDRETASEFSKSRIELGRDHIQLLAEFNLENLPSNYLNYVRGNAGFVGVKKGGIKKAQLIEVCQLYTDLLGDRWREWGSEQFTCNLLISNIDGAVVLPHEYYCVPAKDRPNAKFLHYIGDVRFANKNYQQTSLGVIKQLAA